MKLVFAGTPEFAASALTALFDAGHEIALVLTQPDRAAGRGLAPRPSAVKQLAHARGLAVLQPATLRDESMLEQLRTLAPEAMVVAAYGLILPPAVLAIPRRGCVNIHASLLPRWRGAAPIQRAILAGDAKTGITIMQMDAGLDTGPMLLQESVTIAPNDTAGTLHDKLATLGSQCIVRALQAEKWVPQRQDDRTATYAEKIAKIESAIVWSKPAAEIERMVRAFNPVPGAHTKLAGALVKVWKAEAAPDVHGQPGIVLAVDESGILVACGNGGLRMTELQRAGGRRLSAAAFLAGFPIAAGTRCAA